MKRILVTWFGLLLFLAWKRILAQIPILYSCVIIAPVALVSIQKMNAKKIYTLLSNK